MDWEETNVCGLIIEWDYENGHMDTSIPDYVKDTLKRLQHVPRKYPQYSSHEYLPIHYGKRDTTQYATTPKISEKIKPKDTKYL